MPKRFSDIIPPASSHEGAPKKKRNATRSKKVDIRAMDASERSESETQTHLHSSVHSHAHMHNDSVSTDQHTHTHKHVVDDVTISHHETVSPSAPSPEHRSIRNIPLPAAKQKRLEERQKEEVHYSAFGSVDVNMNGNLEEDEVDTDDDFSNDHNIWTTEGAKQKLFWGLGAVVVVLAITLFSTVFASAHVRIVPKETQVVFSGDAVKLFLSDAALASSTGAAYDVMTVSVSSSVDAKSSTPKVDTKAATATSTQVAKNTRAVGTVILYNTTAVAQSLIKTTRLSTPEGLIYRLDTDVTIPAKKTVSGKVVPGSVEVNVTADQTGASYNSDPKDFKIVGFKGTAKYETFYGRSKTSLTGGTGVADTSTISTSAPMPVAKTSTKASANVKAGPTFDPTLLSKLQDSLRAEIDKKVVASLPAGFTYVPGSVIYTFATPEQTGTGDSTVLKGSVTAYALIVNSQALQQKLFDISQAKGALKDIDTERGASSILFDTADIRVTLPSTATLASLSTGAVAVQVQGTAIAHAVLDLPATVAAISHLSRTDALAVLKNMNTVEAVDISLSPWWKKTLPEASKVTIVIDGKN